MKKIVSFLMGLIILATTTFAQAKQNKTKAAPQSSTAAAPRLKKDGTADKRFKSAKEATGSAATAHLKKDGTPDMRYKTNKTAKKS